MNVDKIANELKQLESFIDGRDIDHCTSYTIKMYISNLKDELGIEKRKKMKLFFLMKMIFLRARLSNKELIIHTFLRLLRKKMIILGTLWKMELNFLMTEYMIVLKIV